MCRSRCKLIPSSLWATAARAWIARTACTGKLPAAAACSCPRQQPGSDCLQRTASSAAWRGRGAQAAAERIAPRSPARRAGMLPGCGTQRTAADARKARCWGCSCCASWAGR